MSCTSVLTLPVSLHEALYGARASYGANSVTYACKFGGSKPLKLHRVAGALRTFNFEPCLDAFSLWETLHTGRYGRERLAWRAGARALYSTASAAGGGAGPQPRVPNYIYLNAVISVYICIYMYMHLYITFIAEQAPSALAVEYKARAPTLQASPSRPYRELYLTQCIN